MKKFVLVGLLLGVALGVNAEEAGKEVKPPEAEKIAPAAPAVEKPYGCYKNLRWGMKFEEAKASLGIKLKNFGGITIKGVSSGYSDIDIGGKAFTINLNFDSTARVSNKNSVHER